MDTQQLTKIDKLIVRGMAITVAVVLVLVPFHAFLTVWTSSLIDHYTLLRLWEEILLILLGIGSVWVLARDRVLRRQLFDSLLTRLIAGYFLLMLVWGIGAYGLHHVSLKALGYGWIVDLRFLTFFLAVWLIASKSSYLGRAWPQLVFRPAVIVIIVGLLQYFVLPYDLLRHFGYNSMTIYPYETINHNLDYIRIMSTLRGANPLGAYLVIIISLALAIWYRYKASWQYLVTAIGGGVALILTFSRSAWIGLILSLALLAYLSIKTVRAKRILIVTGLALGSILFGSFVIFRHNVAFQNAFFHTQEHSAVQSSSNDGHLTALKKSLHDLTHAPLGRGPGTAGPASVYNADHPARIAENYFVQVSQEVGWLGLILFTAINFLVGRELWRRRDQSLALGLLVALIGVSFVNLLSHAWADETLSYLFWGLTAIAIAVPIKSSVKSRENFKKTRVGKHV